MVEFNSSTSFREQVETMAGTGVFISVHTSNLANSQFLPPGSAVVELIQRNWIWDNLDQSFKVGAARQGRGVLWGWRMQCPSAALRGLRRSHVILFGCIALASCAQARLPAPPGANRSLRRFTCPQVQTDRMGDIHHYAWRARHRNQTVYITKRDAQRFGDWPSLQVRGM